MDWINVLEIFGVIGGVATILGLFLAPMFWLGSKIDNVASSLNQKIDDFKDDVNREMKDFHGRLEKQDMEFRMRLLAIEERRSK